MQGLLRLCQFVALIEVDEEIVGRDGLSVQYVFHVDQIDRGMSLQQAVVSWLPHLPRSQRSAAMFAFRVVNLGILQIRSCFA